MQHDAEDEYFINMMKAILPDEMTQEMAQQEANADHRTERQQQMMGGWYEGL
ncbi:hypothetical protein AAGQ96_13015 [Pantoea sp. MBD-2R]|uniref:hypothetical protein n=1 Tax=Pantoea sp. MBD-2R TaxID=3141540 RepID=UPI003183634D